MAIQDQIQPATFKGVPFLVDSSSTRGGRKTVTHEFVNTDNRDVEDLGRLQKTFSLSAMITGPDYFAKRDALIRVLEEEGPGPLVHPFFGRATVVAKPYEVSEDFSTLGEATFRLIFERAGEIADPQPGGSTASSISKQADVAQAAIADDIGEQFEVSSGFPQNFEDAESLLTAVTAEFNNATQQFARNISGINTFSSALDSFSTSIRSLITSPILLGTSIIGLFESVQNLAVTPPESVATLIGFFGFGDGFEPVNQTTAARIEQALNTDTIVMSMQTAALIDAYRDSTEIDFATVDDIDELQAILNTQYEKVIEIIDGNSTFTELQNLRDQTGEFLDDQRISVNRVIDIETNPIPMQVLAHSLYGGVGNTEQLIELNQTRDVSFVSGTVSVLTE